MCATADRALLPRRSRLRPLVRGKCPARVTGTVAIPATSPTTGAPVKPLLHTREVGDFAITCVQLPNGTWTDWTGGYGAETVRQERFELFETMRQRGNDCVARGSRQSVRFFALPAAPHAPILIPILVPGRACPKLVRFPHCNYIFFA